MSSKTPSIDRSSVHEELVQRLAMLKLPEKQRSLFPTIRELLCFAAMLGYSERRRLPLDRPKGVEDLAFQIFERGEAVDIIFLIALAETKDSEVLKDGNEDKCALIFEEYANGGLQILGETMLRGGGEKPDQHILEFLNEREYLPVGNEEPDVSGINF